MRDEELESIKRIDLVAFAAGEFGFEIVKAKSSRNSVCMEAPGGGRIVVSRATDGHMVFFSIHDDTASGSILDLVMHTRNVTLGRARQILRPWIGHHASMGTPIAASRPAAPSTPPLPSGEHLQPISRDRAAVLARWNDFTPVTEPHEWLTTARGIPDSVLRDPRFSQSMRLDRMNNIAFPYFDHEGLCGIEIRGESQKRFLSGSRRGIWAVGKEDTDRQLVITESPIDAFAYAAVHGWDHTRFIATGGTISEQQEPLIRTAIVNMPGGSVFIVACDNDEAGDAFCDHAATIFGQNGRHDLELKEARPEYPGADWGDIAQTRRHPEP